MKNANNTLVFFLGGNDAEMQTIRQTLTAANAEFQDKGLFWGPRASAYQEEIATATAEGKTVVLIELGNAEGADWSGNPLPVIELPADAIEVDHHGARSGEKASILQVLDLLGQEPSRFELLIAANDAAYVPGLIAAGATLEEIAEIRALDRDAQGITPEQEAEAVRALSQAGRDQWHDCCTPVAQQSRHDHRPLGWTAGAPKHIGSLR